MSIVWWPKFVDSIILLLSWLHQILLVAIAVRSNVGCLWNNLRRSSFGCKNDSYYFLVEHNIVVLSGQSSVQHCYSRWSTSFVGGCSTIFLRVKSAIWSIGVGVSDKKKCVADAKLFCYLNVMKWKQSALLCDSWRVYDEGEGEGVDQTRIGWCAFIRQESYDLNLLGFEYTLGIVEFRDLFQVRERF